MKQGFPRSVFKVREKPRGKPDVVVVEKAGKPRRIVLSEFELDEPTEE